MIIFNWLHEAMNMKLSMMKTWQHTIRLLVFIICLSRAGLICPAAESQPASSQPAITNDIKVQAVLLDGQNITGAWISASAAEIEVKIDNRSQTISINKLLSITFKHRQTTTPTTRPTGAQVFLADGSKLRGHLVDGNDGAIILRHPIVGRRKIEFEQLLGLRLATKENGDIEKAFQQVLSNPAETKDTLFLLRDGKLNKVQGLVKSLGPVGGTFKWRERSVRLQTDKVYGIVFAAGVSGTKQPTCRCTLVNGDELGGELQCGDAQSLYFQPTVGMKVELSLNKVSTLHLDSGKVVFLSELEPVNYEFVPFGATRWPYRMNHSVSNGPLQIGEHEYDRGIGMHAESILTFELQNNYQTFAAEIGIDEAVGKRGNVVFRVMGDGVERFASGPVTGNDPPRSILVDIKDVKRLQLIVEFGDELDIGDHADWANVRLIK
jgi:hypothetical protein